MFLRGSYGGRFLGSLWLREGYVGARVGMGIFDWEDVVMWEEGKWGYLRMKYFTGRWGMSEGAGVHLQFQ